MVFVNYIQIKRTKFGSFRGENLDEGCYLCNVTFGKCFKDAF